MQDMNCTHVCHKICIQNLGQNQFSGVLIILTLGFEEFSSFILFECPCDRSYNKLYGNIYMYLPAALLFLFALLKQNNFWRLITGRCKDWVKKTDKNRLLYSPCIVKTIDPKCSKKNQFSEVTAIRRGISPTDCGNG